MQEEISMANYISVFAAGLKVEGDVEAINDIRIDGSLIGNISTSRKVMIGETGKVKGNIHANEVFIMGKIIGDLQVMGLAKIGSTAKVRGTITSTNIHIEAGADVEATLMKIGTVKNEAQEDQPEKLKKLAHNPPLPLHKSK